MFVVVFFLLSFCPPYQLWLKPFCISLSVGGEDDIFPLVATMVNGCLRGKVVPDINIIITIRHKNIIITINIIQRADAHNKTANAPRRRKLETNGCVHENLAPSNHHRHHHQHHRDPHLVHQAEPESETEPEPGSESESEPDPNPNLSPNPNPNPNLNLNLNPKPNPIPSCSSLVRGP